MLNVHQIINIRDMYKNCYCKLAYINKSSWCGLCNEIVDALVFKTDNHRVETSKGDYIAIYRDGYFDAPHFIHIGQGRFLCPMW